MKVKFTKLVGGWGFEVAGRNFMASRNIAGFAHRDWDLIEIFPTGEMRYLEDQLANRAACVEAAASLASKWQANWIRPSGISNVPGPSNAEVDEEGMAMRGRSPENQ